MNVNFGALTISMFTTIVYSRFELFLHKKVRNLLCGHIKVQCVSMLCHGHYISNDEGLPRLLRSDQ